MFVASLQIPIRGIRNVPRVFGHESTKADAYLTDAIGQPEPDLDSVAESGLGARVEGQFPFPREWQAESLQDGPIAGLEHL